MSTTGEPFGLFWDSESGDRTYSASSFEYWLKKFFTSGVFNGDLQVQATSGMTLQVGAGYTNVDGKVKFWTAPFTVTLDAANSTYPRIDTIVITRDNTNRQIICEKVTGQYSGDSPEPTAPVRNAETYQLVLAQVYVPAGATEIMQSNITDTRPDPDLCGYITGTVTEMDFSQFAAQFASYYENFIQTSEADFDAWMAGEQDAFYDWFDNLVYVLDGDVAGHLQNEITDMSNMIGKTLTAQTLSAGSTTMTFSDASILTTSSIDVYCDKYGVAPKDITVTTGQAVLTFNPQSSAISVYIIVANR